MKKNKGFLCMLMLATIVACTEHINTNNADAQDGRITFEPAVGGQLTVSRGAMPDVQVQPVKSDFGQQLYVHTTVMSRDVAETRGTLINNVKTDLKALGSFGVSGYRYTPPTQTVQNVTANFFFNAKVTESSGAWNTSEPYYFPGANDRLAFYAYSPYTASFGTTEVTAISGNNTAAADYGPMTLTYTVNPTLGSQADLMVATNDTLFNPGKKVSLPFRHALTAIRFQLGKDVSPTWAIKSLSIKEAINSAKYKVGTGWTFDTSATRSSFTLNFTSTQKPNGKALSDTDKQLMSDGEYFLMIPQAFTADDDRQCFSVVLKNPTTQEEKTLDFPLKGTTWTAGTVVVYEITTSSVNLVTASISYPADWGGEAFTLKSSYDNAASVGVYAVDIKTKKVVVKNMPLVYNQTAGTWNTTGDDELKYNSNYDYYFYYPYKANISGGHDTGDTFSGSGASTFFSGVISNWTVTDDQSTADKLLPNDLHIGQAVHDTENFTQVSVAMQHALGLAKITLETKDVTPRVHLASGNTAATTTKYDFDLTDPLIYRASNIGIADYMCPNAEKSIYYHIYKGTVSKTFMSTSTGDDQWKSSLTGSIVNGACYAALAELKSVPELAEYDGWYWDYTGKVQSCTLQPGTYQIECWGAQGGDCTAVLTTGDTKPIGGRGAYTSGYITLTSSTTLYMYVGQQGGNGDMSKTQTFNGGGHGCSGNENTQNTRGGGATDIRTAACSGAVTNWSEFNSLKTRIMVAAGGGGATNWSTIGWAAKPASNGSGGAGGGLIGYNGGHSYSTNCGGSAAEINGWTSVAKGGTQTAGGAKWNFTGKGRTWYSTPANGTFGAGGNGSETAYMSGGGSGYYGGGTGGVVGCVVGSSAGGSSFISGHNGCNAITSSSTSSSIVHTGQPNHYSGYVFTNTKMIDGAGYEWTTTAGTTIVGVPKTLASGHEDTGHTGNGFVRIIKIN